MPAELRSHSDEWPSGSAAPRSTPAQVRKYPLPWTRDWSTTDVHSIPFSSSTWPSEERTFLPRRRAVTERSVETGAATFW
jgi:hypothetical protein